MAKTEGLQRLGVENLMQQTSESFASLGANPMMYVLIGGMVLVVVFTVICLLYLRTLEQEAIADEQFSQWHARHAPTRSNAQLPKSMNPNSRSPRPSAGSSTGITRGSYRGAIQGNSTTPKTDSSDSEQGTSMKPNHLRVISSKTQGLLPGQAIADMSLQERIGILHQYVYENVVRLGELRRRINSLELLMGERMYLANRAVNFGILKARRVVRAVESRLNAIEQLIANPTSDQVELACTLMGSDINVPKDAVNALLDEESIAPLSPTDWSDSAEYLLYDAESQVKQAINE